MPPKPDVEPIVFECECGALRMEIRKVIPQPSLHHLVLWVFNTMQAGMALVCGCRRAKAPRM